ncbi:MAG: hypothetical protein KY445_00980 [Armatimonadetes bacterium]|nr:hypothetical protein [Armatimonadota bacterium]
MELIPGLRTGSEVAREHEAARATALKKGVSIQDAKTINAGVEWAEGEEERLKNAVQFFQPHISNKNLISVPLLDKPPCGPWKEAVDRAERFEMSPELAVFVGYEAGDFFAQADGQSMKEAGIPDRALILMRPLEQNGIKLAPTHGEVALVEITTKDGECFSTVKYWYETPEGKPDLRDGAGRPFYPPSGTKKINAVAVKRGLLSRG